MKNKPPYAISSVDHALHLASLLQQEGPMRVTDAAERLDVSASTAHRLLAMLVYRDFAEQGPDRRYHPGKVLGSASVTEAPVALLRRVSLPHLEQLVREVRETANLLVLAGTEVRFIATVECDQVLRVGDRVGRTLPAHLTSAGKAILACLPPAALEELYVGSPADVDLAKLRRELALVRRRGFALNDQQTEAGLTALGVVARGPSGSPAAAVSLAMPRVRFDRDLLPTWVGSLAAAATRMESALAESS
jgi:IclR family acetate operon transcriptional repressor